MQRAGNKWKGRARRMRWQQRRQAPAPRACELAGGAGGATAPMRRLPGAACPRKLQAQRQAQLAAPRLECTPPSDSRPIRCRVPALALPSMYFHPPSLNRSPVHNREPVGALQGGGGTERRSWARPASFATAGGGQARRAEHCSRTQQPQGAGALLGTSNHPAPVASALSTHLAPWSTTWPAPSALCPTCVAGQCGAVRWERACRRAHAAMGAAGALQQAGWGRGCPIGGGLHPRPHRRPALCRNLHPKRAAGQHFPFTLFSFQHPPRSCPCRHRRAAPPRCRARAAGASGAALPPSGRPGRASRRSAPHCIGPRTCRGAENGRSNRGSRGHSGGRAGRHGGRVGEDGEAPARKGRAAGSRRH